MTKGNRDGVQLTSELEAYIEQLRRCSTCHNFDPAERVYVFDYLVDEHTRAGFRHFWKKSVQLYDALHKMAMLNDLAIPRPARKRLSKEIKERRFASRLPEPQDEDRVFRFEEVRFNSIAQGRVVDYVSLSDGEHQLVQILGVFSMVATPNVLFLLDEPESHFNPQWRVRFISRLLDLPTAGGTRRDPTSESAQQDCLLTTHAPFVPCDTRSESVLIFSRNESGGGILIENPAIETFGATFDSILAQCFGVRPPISAVPRKEISELMKSSDIVEVQRGLERLGNSVQRAFLADHLAELIDKQQD